jgi:hypothetical protein
VDEGAAEAGVAIGDGGMVSTWVWAIARLCDQGQVVDCGANAFVTGWDERRLVRGVIASESSMIVGEDGTLGPAIAGRSDTVPPREAAASPVCTYHVRTGNLTTEHRVRTLGVHEGGN